VALDLFARVNRYSLVRRVEGTDASAAVARVEALRARARGGREPELSRWGSLTGQFESGGLSLPELLIAARCQRERRHDLVARILDGPLDAIDDLREVEAIATHGLGVAYDHQMLEAWSLRRDYATAESLALHLCTPYFRAFEPAGRACALAAQIHGRRDDFKGFALPDSASWKAWTAGHSRAERIAFLAAHLRLLNSLQMAQPGGPSLGMPQYGRPWNLTSTFEAAASPGDPRINPWSELEALGLAPADVADLAPFVTDSSFTLTFGFWRDFHPGRNLYTVGELVAEFVNEAARTTLVGEGEEFRLDSSGRARLVDSLRTWSRLHAGKNDEDLDLEVLRTTRDSREFFLATGRARAAGRTAAVPIWLDRAEEFPTLRHEIAEALARLAGPEAVPLARQWVADPAADAPNGSLDAFRDRSVRFWSAVLLTQHGDRARDEGLDVLEGIAREDRESHSIRQVAPILASDGRARALRLAETTLASPTWRWNHTDFDPTGKALFKARSPALLDSLLAGLAEPAGSARLPPDPDTPPGAAIQTRGDLLAGHVRRWGICPVPYEWNASPALRTRQRAAVRAWLEASRAGSTASPGDD
jgi:hypothetical protein